MYGLTDKPIMIDGINYMNLPTNRRVEWPSTDERKGDEPPISFEDELKRQLESLDCKKAQ